MFDVGFSELLVIGVVALVVIGPERLPKVARTAGQWLGRLNRYVSQVKQDIDRDMRLEELRKMQQEMKDSAQKYEIMANETLHRVEDTVAAETGQVSKVMQAMAATDGGLTLREYEKIQAEKAATDAAEKPTGEAQAAPAALDSPPPDVGVAGTGTKPGEEKAQA
jgi:sec-independent protein translocase protein TatB